MRNNLEEKYGDFAQAYDYFDVNTYSRVRASIKNKILAAPYIIFRLPSSKEEYDPKKELTINSHGFRAVEPKKKKEGVHRICVLGGSAAFGVAAMSNELSLTSLLEKSLNERSNGKEQFEVINCAVPSYVSTQQLILLQLSIFDLYEPDTVIFLDGFNDLLSIFASNKIGEPLVWKEYANIFNAIIRGRWFFILTQMFYRRMLSTSQIFGRLIHWMRKSTYPHSKQKEVICSKSLAQETATHYYKTHLLANIISKANKTNSISILQPSIGYGNKKRSLFEEKMVRNHFPAIFGKSFYENLNLFYDKARALFRDNNDGIKWIDLTPVFNGIEETIYIDNVHTGDRWAKIMAANIADTILNRGLL